MDDRDYQHADTFIFDEARLMNQREQVRALGFNPITEGAHALDVHAEGCRDHFCAMYCKCWCHFVDNPNRPLQQGSD